MNKKVIVFGCRGMLGNDLMFALENAAIEFYGFDLPEADITNPDSCRQIISLHQGAVVINAAAYTAVDACETKIDQAFDVNAQGPANLAQACLEAHSAFIHYSTDYVFCGSKPGAYSEEDIPSPLNIYGQSKYEGEVKVHAVNLPDYTIIRTSWLFGPHGRNFVAAILEKADSGQELRVVDDQRGCPTYTRDLAEATINLLKIGQINWPPLIHITNDGSCSWYEFAREILNHSGYPAKPIQTLKTSDLHLPARRPANSVLDSTLYQRIAGENLPHWKAALIIFLDKLDRLKI